MGLKQLYADVAAWIESPRGKRICQSSSRVLLLSTMAFLVYRLTQVGWQQIWQSIPTAPLFYLLFAANYLILPLSEVVTYRLTWNFDFWRAVPAFFRKHVYNHDVVDFSGELYLYVWATKRLRRSDGEALRTIKDNAILSTLAGFIVALVMPLACFVTGQLAPQRNFATHEIITLVAAPLLLCGACGVMWIFRRTIFSLPTTTLAAIGGIHLGRYLLINVLTVIQWAVVMPEQPLYVWCTLLAAQNLIGRLPSVVRRDLIFVAAGVELSQGLSVPAAGVAGMLLVTSVLDSVTNAIIFSTTMLMPGEELQPAPAAAVPQAAPQGGEPCYDSAA